MREVHINAILREIDWFFSEQIKKSEAKKHDILLDAIENFEGVEYVWRKIDRRNKTQIKKIAERHLNAFLKSHKDNTIELFIKAEVTQINNWLSRFPKWETNNKEKEIHFDLEAYYNYLTTDFLLKHIPEKVYLTLTNSQQLTQQKVFYTDKKFAALMEQILDLDDIRIKDFLEFHISRSFENNSMSNLNWLTMLRKHIILQRRKPLTEDEKLKLSTVAQWEEQKREAILRAQGFYGNYFLEKKVTPKKEKPSLSITQLALKFAYEGKKVTRKNGNEIAKENGHNSGEKLFQKFTLYSSMQNRKGKPTPETPTKYKNKIRLFESVIPLLENKHKQRALDELEILKTLFKKMYE